MIQDTPKSDRYFTGRFVKTLLVLYGGICLVYWLASPEDRGSIGRGGAYLLAIICAYRYYRFRFHPFEGAALAWAHTEPARYIQRQLAQRDRLLELTPFAFEDAIAQALRVRFGYVIRQTAYSNDGGWDIEADTDSGRLLIECKRYAPEKKVGRPALQKLHSAIITQKAAGGVLITTSRFSEHAEAFAADVGIELIDGELLARLVRDAYPEPVPADVTYSMCTRCGALVSFPDSPETIRKACPSDHRIRNTMIEVFRQARNMALVDEGRKLRRKYQRTQKGAA